MVSTRRTRRSRLVVVLTAAGLALLGAACGSEPTVVQAPTPTTYRTAPPNTEGDTIPGRPTTLAPETTSVDTASSEPTGPPATGSGAILGITLAPSRTLTGAEVADVSRRLQGRIEALGYDAQLSLASTGQWLIAITGASQGEGETIAANLAAIAGNIYLRPVLTDDQFGLPCLPGHGSQPTGGTTSQSLPSVSPDSSGYAASLGGGLCKVGPAAGNRDVFAGDAKAFFMETTGSWGVTVSLKPGPSGEGVWNSLASDCFNAATTCPTRQLAIELDGLVITAPTVEQPEFSGTVQLAGTFTQAEADALADVLNSGASDYSLSVVDTRYIIP